MMTRSELKQKQAEIEAQTKQFLENGGVIEQVPYLLRRDVPVKIRVEFNNGDGRNRKKRSA